MKIYTKTGDKGKTSLFGGGRVPKHHLRIEAYGTVDELNSYIGLIRDQEIKQTTKETLITIQNDLFALGAMLATPIEKSKKRDGTERLTILKISNKSVTFLEQEIDNYNKELPKMTHFVLPGGHTTVSYCHIARCVCRRAERITSLLAEKTEIQPEIITYLNRLSDYLFVLARKLTYELQAVEIKWIPTKKN